MTHGECAHLVLAATLATLTTRSAVAQPAPPAATTPAAGPSSAPAATASPAAGASAAPGIPLAGPMPTFTPYPYAPYPYPYMAPYPAPPPNPYELPPLPPRRRRNEQLHAWGIVAVATGVATVLLGSYFVASAVGRIDIYCDMPSIPCAHKNDATRMTGGAITMALGGVLGVAGVPMWVLGSEWVTLPTPSGRQARLPRLQPSWSCAPELRLGLGSATATLRF